MKKLNCFVENDYGLVSLEISFDGDDVTVWENGDLNDSICSFQDLVEDYKENYYDTKEDYKKGNIKNFHDFVESL